MNNDWTELARCREVDPEVWFPTVGESPEPAKAICRDCEVQPQCLEDALATHNRFGVWGGLTYNERRPLLGLGRKHGKDIEDASRSRTLRILLLHQGGMPLHRIAEAVDATPARVGRVIADARRKETAA